MAVSSKPERVLARAKNLLANRGWTQGVFARDKNGREVSAGDSKATRFCINGAIDRACRGIKNGSARAAAWSKAADAVQRAVPKPFGAVGYNDATGRKRKEMIALLDEAIKLAKAGQL